MFSIHPLLLFMLLAVPRPKHKLVLVNNLTSTKHVPGTSKLVSQSIFCCCLCGLASQASGYQKLLWLLEYIDQPVPGNSRPVLNPSFVEIYVPCSPSSLAQTSAS